MSALTPTLSQRERESKAVIQTIGLTREYQMGSVILHALRGIDLTVYQGDFIALMGASGSGKSTLLSLIGLLDRATAGEYFLEEIEVSSLSRNELADIRGRRIGFIFQNFNLLPRFSAWENVALPLKAARRHRPCAGHTTGSDSCRRTHRQSR